MRLKLRALLSLDRAYPVPRGPAGDANGITGTTQMTLKKGDLVQVIGTDQIRKVDCVVASKDSRLFSSVWLTEPVKGFKCWLIKDLQVVKGKRVARSKE